jgi:His-Xaa-Ser system protein HxsD
MASEIIEKKIFFASSVYSEEAVNMAAFILEDKMHFIINKKENGIEVTFKHFSENEPEIFANEALNQQCRIDVSKVSSGLTKLIVSKALVSAVGGGKQE